jgi:hypothetical protein
MKHRLLQAFITFAFILGPSARCVRAQQDPPPPQSPDEANSEKSDTATPNTAQEPTVPGEATDVSSSAPSIRAMNGAGPLLAGRASPIQLGPIYLQSADAFQSVIASSSTVRTDTRWRSYSLFRAAFVFDQSYKTSRIAVQYQPRVTVIEGTPKAETANLNAAWSTLFRLTPVLKMSLNNSLNYYSQQSQFDNLDLMADVNTGALVQSQFLEGNGHLLSDRTDLPIQYQITPRSRVDATPFFEYYSSSGSTQTVTQSQGYGLGASYGYLLDPTKRIGFQYQIEDIQFSKFLPNTIYQSFSVGYSQQLSLTLRFFVSGGITTSQSPQGNTSSGSLNSTQKTGSGSASLIKAFRDGSLAFNYYRGQTLGLQITNGFADRYDAAYQRHLSVRTTFDLGAGYYREFQSVTNTSGIYSSLGLGYRLTDKWSLLARYGYKNQRDGGVTFATGDLHYLSFGIRWEPRVINPGR